MEIVRVSKTPKPNGVLIENIGWVDNIASGITILRNVEYLDLVSDEKLIKSDRIIAKTGDFYLVERCSCENHVVKPMETIDRIARENNITVDYLIKTNSLKTTNLFIGQILKI